MKNGTSRKSRPLSAKAHDAKFKATMKRIGAIQKRMDEREKKNAPMWRELRKIAGE